jgi:hypothetical protein
VRLGRHTFRNWPAAVLFGVLAAAFISGSSRPFLALAFFVVGGALMTVGVLRIRRPDWREMAWWRDRPLLRLAFSWQGTSSPTSVWGERAAGTWQFAIGLVFFAAGVLVVL